MFKFLCKAENFTKKQEIVKLLEEHSVKYRIKITGPNIFQIAGYENKAYWFAFYVEKSDYDRASGLVKNM